MRTRDDFLEFATAWWPVLDAATVLGWLRDPELLARVSEGVLDEESVRLLSKSWAPRRRCRSTTCRCSTSCATCSVTRRSSTPARRTTRSSASTTRLWSAAMQEVTTASDREYAGQAGWTPPTNRVEDDGYAHVLVDEAQDLTPMQWRMVGRRGRHATWTVVGDPAQSSWPDPAEAQAAREQALELAARRPPASRLPPVHQLPQQRGDLRLRRLLRQGGRSRRRPAQRGAHDGRGARRARGRRPRVLAAVPARGRWPARSRERSEWWSPSPGTARSAAGSRRGPSSPGPRPVGRRAGSSCSQGWTPRAWSSTASWSSQPHEIERSRPPAAPPSTSSTPAPPSGWSPSPSVTGTGRQNGGGPTIRIVPVAVAARRMLSRSTGAVPPRTPGSLAAR